MLRIFQRCLLGLLLAGGLQTATAFTPLGPLEAWQTPDIGYGYGGDLGGPKNLGEEYRWNAPVVTYAFDPTFLNYFGSNGVAAVDKAFAILNTLPPVSSLSSNLIERQFQGEKRGINHFAASLGIIDVTSWTMGLMMEEMGLGSPDRYTWTLRGRTVINNVPYYSVMMRNFDPVTLQPTRYANGTMYSYQIVQVSFNPDWWEAVEVQVDPTSTLFTTLAAFTDNNGAVLDTQSFFRIPPIFGIYWTGLTRDDIGGLRYLFNPRNFNVDTAPPLTTLSSDTGGAFADPFGGNPSSFNSPWSDPFGLGIIITNIFTNVFNGVIVDPALRSGVDKVAFQRVDFDGLLGSTFSFTNRYVDYYLTNGVVQSQNVERIQFFPDILISAADLGLTIDGAPVLGARTVSWVDQSILNSNGGNLQAGPGTIQGPIELTFSKIGPNLWHIFEGFEVDGFPLPYWGSFDGSTNEPVVYPSGTSIRDLESQVLRRQ